VSQAVHQGNTAVFEVTASGTGPLSYQWYKWFGGFFTVRLSDNGGTIGGAQTSRLWLSEVIADNDGDYSVLVSDSCGSVYSSPASLTVVPWAYNVTKGTNCTIELDASDRGVDYELIRLSPVFTHMVQLLNGTGGPLSFGPCLAPGVYTVKAGWTDPYCTEDCGWAPMNGTAEVVAVEVDSLSAACSSTNSIGLDWSLSGVSSSSCITGFVIKRSTAQGGPYTVIHIAGSNDRHYVDTTAVPYVTYYYVVAMQSGTCESPPPSDEAYSSTCPVLNNCSKPSYDPTYWNDNDVVWYNNCYNYANNVRTDTFAQPGRASGTMCTNFMNDGCITGTYTYQAAVNDGLVPSSRSAVCPYNMSKVALVFQPDEDSGNRDYHWYRQDANGLWTHKMGSDPATNLDNSQPGKIITDPETADRDGYIEFVGYLCTCSSVTQGMGHANIR
jgi:hypothetical protein